MTMTMNEKPVSETGQLWREVIGDELLDQLLASTTERGIALTGDGGLLPELLNAVLERGDAGRADVPPGIRETRSRRTGVGELA